ncbi:MAG: YbaB/EbfC family nucleoid-associated protein [Spirochaetales bacterium]|nr:YbaB/EbfC family nucleoid-associated protein [Spirochaetales bacterium]
MNPYELLKNLPGLQQKAQEMQQKLRTVTVVGESGAGLVKIEMNGAMEVVSVSIDPAVFDAEHAQTVEVLLASAINSAIAEARTKAMEIARSNMGGA